MTGRPCRPGQAIVAEQWPARARIKWNGWGGWRPAVARTLSAERTGATGDRMAAGSLGPTALILSAAAVGGWQ